MYQPADGDLLPSYFYAMLDDADRSLKYWEAIKACIRDLRATLRDDSREVVVVDVGVGTGMLSAFAIHAGADLVIGVGVNAAAIAAAELRLMQSAATRRRAS